MSTSGNAKKRPYSDVSHTDTKPLNVCSKCNKKCKGESIQCDLCDLWVHATCEGITREHFKVIKSLSSLSNFIFYCQVNNCASRIKNITFEWVQSLKLIQWFQTSPKSTFLLSMQPSKKL